MKLTKSELDILEEKRNQRIAEIENAIDKDLYHFGPGELKKLQYQKRQLVGKFPNWQKLLE